MPKPTYVQLNSITLAAATASVTFSNIPQNYRDLIFIFEGTVAPAATNILASLNGDTSNIYARAQMSGTGSTAGSSTGTHTGLYVVYGQSGERVFAQFQLMDYSATDKHKTALSRGHSSGSEVAARVLRWPSNAAVTSMAITSSNGNYNSGSTFTLYGIEA